MSEVVHLIELNYSGGSIYINNAAQTLSWNGISWLAVGGNLTFGGVEESSDQGGQGVELTLSGVDQTILAVLLSNDFRGRIVRVYRAYWDTVLGTVIPDPDLEFEGLQLGAYEIREERGQQGGTVSIKTRVIGQMGLKRVRGIWTNQTSHQNYYPGDIFFQFTTQLSNQKVYWGTPAPARIGTQRHGRDVHG